MKFKIHQYETDDFFIIEEETIEECRKSAREQVKRRGWKAWSERI